MNYKFILVDSIDGFDKRHWILPPPVTVGRCPTAEITIGDPSISRRHCQFYIDPHGSLVVRDLGSKNGVFLEDRRVDKAIVQPGTQIRIGLVTLRAEWTDEEAEDAASAKADQVFDLGETQPVKIIRPEDPADDARYDIG